MFTLESILVQSSEKEGMHSSLFSPWANTQEDLLSRNVSNINNQQFFNVSVQILSSSGPKSPKIHVADHLSGRCYSHHSLRSHNCSPHILHEMAYPNGIPNCLSLYGVNDNTYLNISQPSWCFLNLPLLVLFWRISPTENPFVSWPSISPFSVHSVISIVIGSHSIAFLGCIGVACASTVRRQWTRR